MGGLLLYRRSSPADGKKIKPLLTGDNPMSDHHPSAYVSTPVPNDELS